MERVLRVGQTHEGVSCTRLATSTRRCLGHILGLRLIHGTDFVIAINDRHNKHNKGAMLAGSFSNMHMRRPVLPSVQHSSMGLGPRPACPRRTAGKMLAQQDDPTSGRAVGLSPQDMYE